MIRVHVIAQLIYSLGVILGTHLAPLPKQLATSPQKYFHVLIAALQKLGRRLSGVSMILIYLWSTQTMEYILIIDLQHKWYIYLVIP